MEESFLFGLGLRPHHYPQWREQSSLPILEVLADNYLFQKGGPGLAHLRTLGERTSLLLHGVGLNIGGPQPLNQDYLRALKILKDEIKPLVVSDHFCFSAGAGGHSYDLLPLARTPRLMTTLRERVEQIQDTLGAQFSLENVSSYVEHKDNQCSELEFLNELAGRTGCGILLDVNNVFVSAHNHGFKPWAEILKVDPRHVTQYHIAGHLEEGDVFIDTHDQTIKDEVWQLLFQSWKHIGPRPLILERDDDAPLEPLLEERAFGLNKAKLWPGVFHNA